MSKIRDLLKGKKTYIVMALGFALGGLQAIGYVVPDWVYLLLASLGVGTLRAGINKEK